MGHVEIAIVVTKTVTLVLGALITFFAWRAHRRTDSSALRALAVGFGTITVGALLAGIVDLLTPFDVLYSILLESSLTLIGFAIITYSLYAD